MDKILLMFPCRTVCPYDVGVVVSFGYLLPSRLIRWFPRLSYFVTLQNIVLYNIIFNPEGALTFIHPCCQDIGELHQYSIQSLMMTSSVAVQYWNYQNESVIKDVCHVIYKLLSKV